MKFDQIESIYQSFSEESVVQLQLFLLRSFQDTLPVQSIVVGFLIHVVPAVQN